MLENIIVIELYSGKNDKFVSVGGSQCNKSQLNP